MELTFSGSEPSGGVYVFEFPDLVTDTQTDYAHSFHKQTNVWGIKKG